MIGKTIAEKIRVFFTCVGALKEKHNDGSPKKSKIDTKKVALHSREKSTATIGNRIKRSMSIFFRIIWRDENISIFLTNEY